MAHENCAQTRRIVELGFEWKNTKHQVQRTRHLLDPAAIPSPHLRTNVIDDFARRSQSAQRAGQTQIEAGIINQNDRVRFLVLNLVESLAKFLSEITVVLDDLPESNDSRVADPVVKIFFSNRLHFWPTAPNKVIIRAQFAKRTHQRGAMIVATHFTGAKIDRLQGHLGISPQ